MATSLGDRISRDLDRIFGFLLVFVSPLFLVLLVTTLACFGHNKPVQGSHVRADSKM